jgi:hypothetical protein
MKLRNLVIVLTIILLFSSLGYTTELPPSRLYAFDFPNASMVCQFTPDNVDQNIETGTAIFWQLGTPHWWAYYYTDNELVVHLDGFPGYFYHLGCNGLVYVKPGGFTMILQ